MPSSLEIIKEQIRLIPDNASGIYKMLNKRVLYVGKSKNLKHRLNSYLQTNKLSHRIQHMVSQITKIEVIITENEIDALLLESQLIKSLKPAYNIMLKDDKSYPYIVISNHDYPRISKYRGKIKNGDYYGPFTSSLAVKHTINTIQKAFLLRSCTDTFFTSRTKPCIEYQIKRCSAPCVNKISKADYAASVNLAKAALSGDNKKVQNKLFTQMEQASKTLNYELACVYRDRLKALQQIQEHVSKHDPNRYNDDIIGFYKENNICCIQIISYRNGYNYGNRPYFLDNVSDASDNEIISNFLIQFYKIDIPDKIFIDIPITDHNILELALNKISGNSISILKPQKDDTELLQLISLANKLAATTLMEKLSITNNILQNLTELTNIFKLTSIPERIEVYDNSHISGTNPVGVMIVANQEGFVRSQYKKFSLDSVKNGDDYSMMKEMITKRFSGSIKDIIPDLLIIDGGPGHMSVIEETMKTLCINIPFICMAKGPYRNAGNETFYTPQLMMPITLEKSNKLLLYLQSLRNEAHRFAVSTHKNKRNKKFLSSSKLDRIPGIGKKRKKLLLAYFGSVDAIAQSTLEDLQKVPGINLTLAQLIIEYLSL